MPATAPAAIEVLVAGDLGVVEPDLLLTLVAPARGRQGPRARPLDAYEKAMLARLAALGPGVHQIEGETLADLVAPVSGLRLAGLRLDWRVPECEPLIPHTGHAGYPGSSGDDDGAGDGT